MDRSSARVGNALAFVPLVVLWTFVGCGSTSSSKDIVDDTSVDSLTDLGELDTVLDDLPALVDGLDPPDAGTTPHGALALCVGNSVGAPLGVSEEGGTWVISCDAVTLRLTPINAHTLRMRYVGAIPDAAPDRSYAVVATPDVNTETAQLPLDGGFRLCTQFMAIDVAEGSCRLRIQDDTGQVILDDGDTGGYFEGPGVAEGFDAWGVGVRRTIVDNEHFYGFGERNGGLDKRGSVLWFWNSDVPGYSPTTDPLYQAIPFFVGLRGTTAYGVLTDNSYRMRMDMGSNASDWAVVEAHGGEMDQYVITGPSIASVVERYTTLTGRMSLPPRWTLGYHQSRHGYFPDTQVLEIADGLRERNFPVDAMWLDIDYMDEYRIFTWGESFSADPAAMIAQLRSDGIRTVVIIDPGTKVDDQWDIYTEGLANGYYIKNPDGTPFVGQVWPGASVYPDYTNPATRAWWGDLIPLVTSLGVEGIWIDMNEPANFDDATAWTVPNHVEAHGDGTAMTMAEAHNLYGSGMAHATFDGLRKHHPDRRPFVLTRAGYAGVQRYAAVWTGDVPSTWKALETTLPMMLNMGLSGVSFVGSDVGGWMGGVSGDLFARWMQLGAISPFYRNHTQKNTEMQEPWRFGAEVEEVGRVAVQQRYRLLPYWYTLFEECSRSGAPMLRPMVYDFQDDGSVHTLSTQAMLGPWLLVAPVLEGGTTERVVYFPDGQWMELESGALFEGPSLSTVSVRLGALPTYLRPGAIIPRQQGLEWTDETPIGPLFLDLYPHEEPSTFTLYEDDGESMAYQDGAWSRRTYELQSTPAGAQLVMGARQGAYEPPERTVSIRLRRVDFEPYVVYWNGEKVPEYKVGQTPKMPQGGPGWRYDSEDLAIVVYLPDDDAESVLTFEYPLGLKENATSVMRQFRVEVPEGTDTSTPVYIALSSNDWAHIPLEWAEGESNVATSMVTVPRGEWVDYKYTRGDWSTVEKYGDCSEATNRYGFGKAHPAKLDRVEAWAGDCP